MCICVHTYKSTWMDINEHSVQFCLDQESNSEVESNATKSLENLLIPSIQGNGNLYNYFYLLLLLLLLWVCYDYTFIKNIDTNGLKMV